MFNHGNREHHSITRAAYGSGATIIDLSANPYDLRPAINAVLERVKVARTARQKVVVLFGETHSKTSQVILPRLTSDAYRVDPQLSDTSHVIGIELHANIHEQALLRKPNLFQTGEIDREQIIDVLRQLKIIDPDRYHSLQALSVKTIKELYSPVSHLENKIAWQQAGVKTRFIDGPREANNLLDYAHPEVQDFMKDNPITQTLTAWLYPLRYEMALRNYWMVRESKKILEDNDVLFVVAGKEHVGGKVGIHQYQYSYHGLFSRSAKLEGVRLITVFCESAENKYDTYLSRNALSNMESQDLVVVRGGCSERFELFPNSKNREEEEFKREAETYSRIFNSSGVIGFPPVVKSWKDYNDRLDVFETLMVRDIQQVMQQYAPQN